MDVKVCILNSFTQSRNGGNPAGVVLNSENLSEGQMMKISGIVNLSETAFVSASKLGDFKVRFFTPNAEVDLCGHATIAAFSLMSSLKMINQGNYFQETKAGLLNVQVFDDGLILMDQNRPEFYECTDKSEIAKSLNIDKQDLIENVPAQVVSTALRDIMVPVKSRKILYSIKPDFDMISKLSRKYKVTGMHVFTTQALEGGNAHCRNFAPLYDIPEEAATGTSSGALACYLYKHGFITQAAAKSLMFEQGYSMNRPSKISASLAIQAGEVISVKVGGKAVINKEMTVII